MDSTVFAEPEATLLYMKNNPETLEGENSTELELNKLTQ